MWIDGNHLSGEDMTTFGPNVTRTAQGQAAYGVLQNISALKQLSTIGIADHGIIILYWGSSWYLDRSDSTTSEDNITVITSKEGTRWKRSTRGIDGSNLITSWFIDSIIGSDENDGITESTALKSPEELLRRLNGQYIDGNITPNINIHLNGDFSDRTISSSLYLINSPIINFIGKRSLNNIGHIVTATTAWDGPTHQIHNFTVPGLNWTPFINTFFAIVGGDRNGLSVPIVANLGSGVARSPGCYDFNNFFGTEIQVGDTLFSYTIPKIGGLVYSSIIGNGVVIFYDCEIGAPFDISGGHSVNINGSRHVFINCIINGMENMRDALTFSFGSIIIGCHNYGWMSDIESSVFTSPGSQALGGRGTGYIDFGTNNILQGQGIALGNRDGPGFMLIEGLLACCDYNIPTIVEAGSSISCGGAGFLWMHNSAGSSQGYLIKSRSGIVYINPPAITGTAPTFATSIGGTTSVSLSLPTSTINGASIVVNQ